MKLSPSAALVNQEYSNLAKDSFFSIFMFDNEIPAGSSLPNDVVMNIIGDLCRLTQTGTSDYGLVMIRSNSNMKADHLTGVYNLQTDSADKRRCDDRVPKCLVIARTTSQSSNVSVGPYLYITVGEIGSGKDLEMESPTRSKIAANPNLVMSLMTNETFQVSDPNKDEYGPLASVVNRQRFKAEGVNFQTNLQRGKASGTTLWAGLGSHGLLKSTDLGAIYTQKLAVIVQDFLAVGDTVVVVDTSGNLHKSEDGGESWEALAVTQKFRHVRHNGTDTWVFWNQSTGVYRAYYTTDFVTFQEIDSGGQYPLMVWGNYVYSTRSSTNVYRKEMVPEGSAESYYKPNGSNLDTRFVQTSGGNYLLTNANLYKCVSQDPDDWELMCSNVTGLVEAKDYIVLGNSTAVDTSTPLAGFRAIHKTTGEIIVMPGTGLTYISEAVTTPTKTVMVGSAWPNQRQEFYWDGTEGTEVSVEDINSYEHQGRSQYRAQSGSKSLLVVTDTRIYCVQSNGYIDIRDKSDLSQIATITNLPRTTYWAGRCKRSDGVYGVVLGWYDSSQVMVIWDDSTSSVVWSTGTNYNRCFQLTDDGASVYCFGYGGGAMYKVNLEDGSKVSTGYFNANQTYWPMFYVDEAGDAIYIVRNYHRYNVNDMRLEKYGLSDNQQQWYKSIAASWSLRNQPSKAMLRNNTLAFYGSNFWVGEFDPSDGTIGSQTSGSGGGLLGSAVTIEEDRFFSFNRGVERTPIDTPARGISYMAIGGWKDTDAALDPEGKLWLWQDYDLYTFKGNLNFVI